MNCIRTGITADTMQDLPRVESYYGTIRTYTRITFEEVGHYLFIQSEMMEASKTVIDAYERLIASQSRAIKQQDIVIERQDKALLTAMELIGKYQDYINTITQKMVLPI